MSEQKKNNDVPVVEDIVNVSTKPSQPKEFDATYNIELRIIETQQKLSDVCNQSQLTPGVLALIIANLFSQVNDIAKARADAAVQEIRKLSEQEVSNGNPNAKG